MNWREKADWFPKADLEQSTDWRHCAILYAIAEHSEISSVIEVGSYAGHSTAVWLELLKEGKLNYLNCVDTTPQPALITKLQDPRVQGKTTLHQMDSKYYFTNPESVENDLVYLDGNHTQNHVLSEWRCSSIFAKIIALHDSSYGHYHYASNGPMYAKQEIMGTGGWLCFEDAKRRQGERTERGLFIAVRAELVDLCHHVRDIYRLACLD